MNADTHAQQPDRPDAPHGAADEAADDTDVDPDSDPRNLNPRSGAAAHADTPADADADPDAEPSNLNPRARDT